jgi:hypothetical protein
MGNYQEEKKKKAKAAAAGAVVENKNTKPKVSAKEYAEKVSHLISDEDGGPDGADAWIKRFRKEGYDDRDAIKAIRYARDEKPHLYQKKREIPESLKPQPSSLTQDERPKEYFNPYSRQGILGKKFIDPETLKPSQPERDPDEIYSEQRQKNQKAPVLKKKYGKR